MTTKKPTKKMNVLKVLFFLFFAAAHFTPLTAAGAGQAEQEPIQHEVSVDVMLIPVFVTGPDGNPVHDLKKEDFKLYANGTPVEITNFIRFDFTHQQEVLEKVPVTSKRAAAKKPSRAIFVIIDGVFNGVFAYRRAKSLSIEIIKNSSPDDMFIVIENTGGGGLRYIGGPEDSRKKLITKIQKLKLPSAKWSKSLYWSQEWNYEADTDIYDPIEATASLENLSRRKKDLERLTYKNQALHFTRALTRFKYALKTVTRPKVVFLLSEGISKAAFKIYKESEKVASYGKFGSALLRLPTRVNKQYEFRDQRLFHNLERTVKAINQGGSVIYTVNPGKFNRDDEASGEMSLRYLAYESGGDYIAGSDTKKVINKIKKTTGAYYELAFVPFPDMGKNIDIQLKCKRKDVKVNTFKQTERTKPYFRMDPVEKKVFAINMVTGGSWSRMMGKVMQIKYSKLKTENTGDETNTMIEVPLPEKMKGRQLDIFSIQIDPKTQKVQINLMSRTVKDRADLIIKKRKNKTDFFVIIEPVFAYCIYNQVK